MKNLLTLLALFLITGIANAQNKKPTKEETVKYINDLFKDVYDNGSVKVESVVLDKTVLIISYTDNNEKKYKNRTYLLKTPKLSVLKLDAGDKYRVQNGSRENDLTMCCINMEEDAMRLKKALEHLIEILKNEKNTDPFGD